MPKLKPNPLLRDMQQYVRELEQERGFSHETTLEKCLLLGEEVGELFKAVRKTENIKTDQTSAHASVEEELADILIYLCAVANRYEVDLETAFREKEEINKKRTWS